MLPLLLRGFFLFLLGAAFLVPMRFSGESDTSATIRLPRAAFAVSDPPAIYDSLLVGTSPGRVVRASTIPPTAAELATLEAIAGRAPLFVALPGAPELVRLEPPANPRADRAAAVPFRVLGEPGDTILVRLSDQTGALDSIPVGIDSSGVAVGAFRVRPSRPGWKEWMLDAAERRAVAGAWVEGADSLHLLVAAGPPTWESRFVVQALEESGAYVDLVQPLGRGLHLGGGPRAVPSAAAALEEYDAVLLLGGADVDAAQLRAIDAYVSDRGGGVLTVGAAGGTTAWIARSEGAIEIDGDAVRWSLPPEITPLPAADVRVAAEPMVSAFAGTFSAAAVPQGDLLVLRPLGRGRVAALGLLESWRWRMGAGQVAEHRAFWRSLADWLAGGARQPYHVRLVTTLGSVGEEVEVEVFLRDVPRDPEVASEPELALARPGGLRESLPLVPDPRRPEVFRSAFIPATEGVYSLAINGAPAAGFRAVMDLESPSAAWARLALLADRSDGFAAPPDALEEILRRRAGDSGTAPNSRLPWRPVLFGVLIALAASEWAIRRLTGRR